VCGSENFQIKKIKKITKKKQKKVKKKWENWCSPKLKNVYPICIFNTGALIWSISIFQQKFCLKKSKNKRALLTMTHTVV